MSEPTGASATGGAAAPAAGAVAELDEDAFGRLIPNHPFAIVDFWAPWCAPCRAFAPVFAEAAKRHPEIMFAKVDTEQHRSIAAHFNIRSIPTLMVFRDNVIVFEQAGALPASALEEVVSAAAALDMNEVRRELEATEPKSASTDPS